MPRVYAFHGEYVPGLTKTNYLAIVGYETLWPANGKRRHSELTDSATTTILLVENNGWDAQWMEPRDLEYDAMSFTIPDPNGVSSKYLEPAVVMADDSLLRLARGFPSEVFRAMLTINGGETLQNDGDTWSVLGDGRERATRESRRQ